MVDVPQNPTGSIVFDFDDTLIVSKSDRAALLLHALDSFGTPASSDMLAKEWGKPFYELVTRVAPLPKGRYSDFLLHYADLLASHPPRVRPGATIALSSLRLTHNLFVHSASHSLLVRTDLQSVGLLNYFDFVCGSDWQIAPKPAARSLELLSGVLRLRGLDMESAWYVGDAVTDVAVAASYGARFVGLADDDQHVKSFLRAGVPPAYIIQTLAQLPEIVTFPPRIDAEPRPGSAR